jgi:hypothetical protein
VPGPLYEDGQLGPVNSWPEPNNTALWVLLVIVSAIVVLPPMLIAAIYVAARCG